MTQASIRAALSFSYQGKTHELTLLIPLKDALIEAEETPDFHRILAKAHAIDPYSYLYEVLESHDILFSEASGLAAQYCHEGNFDWPAFRQAWRDERDTRVIGHIAEQLLGIADLESRADIKAALLAAYRAGLAHGVD